MAKLLFKNVIGEFEFSENCQLVGKIKGKSGLDSPNEGQRKKILASFKQNKFYPEFYKENLRLTKEAIRTSGKDDIIIVQAIKSIKELERIRNILLNRMRDWYGYHNPELARNIGNQEKMVELILKKDRKTLLKEMKINEKDSIGIEFSKEDLNEINQICKEIQNIEKLKGEQEKYLEKIMRNIMPNTTEIATPLIGAELIELAGSMRNLMEMPSSTVQLLGAEKSLFRHIRNKKNLAPKYGIIFNHPLLQNADMDNKGKIARLLAGKINIAVKVDFFKGKSVGDRLKKEINEKIKEIEKKI
ncbi:MAG: NOP5/NOP56 family protein [Candidatus Woesearchaeota archaeon]